MPKKSILLLSLVLTLFMGSQVAAHQAARQAGFVEPQDPRPDGSLVHVVQFGDTLDGIVFAYSNYGITKEDLIEVNGWRWEPQFIYVGDEIIILPPGSIDPATGAVTGSAASAPATTDTAAGGETAPADTAPAAETVASLPTADPASLAPALAAPLAEGDAPVLAIAPFLPAE